MSGMRCLPQTVSLKKAVLSEQGEYGFHDVLILQQNLEFYLNKDKKCHGECYMSLLPGSTAD